MDEKHCHKQQFPTIIASESMTNEELIKWLREKASQLDYQLLCMKEVDRAKYVLKMAEVNITNLQSIEGIVRVKADPTHHP